MESIGGVLTRRCTLIEAFPRACYTFLTKVLASILNLRICFWFQKRDYFLVLLSFLMLLPFHILHFFATLPWFYHLPFLPHSERQLDFPPIFKWSFSYCLLSHIMYAAFISLLDLVSCFSSLSFWSAVKPYEIRELFHVLRSLKHRQQLIVFKCCISFVLCSSWLLCCIWACVVWIRA